MWSKRNVDARNIGLYCELCIVNLVEKLIFQLFVEMTDVRVYYCY